MIRRARPAVMIALASLAAIGFARLQPATTPAPCETPDEAALAVSAPASVQAGSPFVLVVQAPAGAPDEALSVLVAGGGSPRTVRTSLAGGIARVSVPGSAVRVAGPVRIEARTCSARGSATLRVIPGPPVDPVGALAGPKRIVADGRDWSVVLAIPHDAFGNGLPDGTPVRFLSHRPDGSTPAVTTAVHDLVAWQRIDAGTVAGRIVVAAAAGAARGPMGEILVVAGPPVPDFPIRVVPARDGGQGWWRAVVTNLLDVNGNQLPDGTLVTLSVADPDGSRRILQAPLIAGGAAFDLAPATSNGMVVVTATVMGVRSGQAAWTSESGETTLPITARYDAASGSVVVLVGPVLDPIGGYPTDGTAVDVTVTCPRGWTSSRTARLRDGLASIVVPVGSADGGAGFAIAVRVRGAVAHLEVDLP